jgi:AraC-like DNA-binding protein
MIGYNEILRSVDLENIASSSTIDSNSINRNYKLRQTAIFNALREANPHLKSKELAEQMGTSPSTLQRIRKDLNMKSPYRYDIATPKRKKKDDTQTSSMEKETEKPTTIVVSKPKGRPISKIRSNPPAGNNDEIASHSFVTNMDEINRQIDEGLKNIN